MAAVLCFLLYMCIKLMCNNFAPRGRETHIYLLFAGGSVLFAQNVEKTLVNGIKFQRERKKNKIIQFLLACKAQKLFLSFLREKTKNVVLV